MGIKIKELHWISKNLTYPDRDELHCQDFGLTIILIDPIFPGGPPLWEYIVWDGKDITDKSGIESSKAEAILTAIQMLKNHSQPSKFDTI